MCPLPIRRARTPAPQGTSPEATGEGSQAKAALPRTQAAKHSRRRALQPGSRAGSGTAAAPAAPSPAPCAFPGLSLPRWKWQHHFPTAMHLLFKEGAARDRTARPNLPANLSTLNQCLREQCSPQTRKDGEDGRGLSLQAATTISVSWDKKTDR